MKEIRMKKEGYANLTLVLSIIAAVLALAGALIEYLRKGDVKITLIAAGIFILVFGLGARSRMMPGK
jgi:uncharacterized membrane protein (UPF0136 family)